MAGKHFCKSFWFESQRSLCYVVETLGREIPTPEKREIKMLNKLYFFFNEKQCMMLHKKKERERFYLLVGVGGYEGLKQEIFYFIISRGLWAEPSSCCLGDFTKMTNLAKLTAASSSIIQPREKSWFDAYSMSCNATAQIVSLLIKLTWSFGFISVRLAGQWKSDENNEGWSLCLSNVLYSAIHELNKLLADV